MGLKIGQIGDIHIGPYQGKMETGGMNSRFIDFVKTYNESIDKIIEEKCDMVAVTGDIFKTKMPTPEESNEFAKGLMKLDEAGIFTLIILGNHDEFLADNRTHSIGVIQTLLSNNKNFHISADPELVLVDLPNGKIQVQTMPYPIRSVLRLKDNTEVVKYIEDKTDELYKSRDKSIPIMYAGHFTLGSATVGDEQRYVDKFSEPVISASIFKKKKYVHVAMGHIHKFQESNIYL